MSESARFRRSAPVWARIALTVVLAATAPDATAAEPAPGGHPYDPPVVGATPDASRAMASFRKPPGWSVELFAAEPMLANPVAFGFDEKGKVYVVETFRLHRGVVDNRGHMSWLADDLASKTVTDRVAMYRKHLGKDAESYGVEHDRVRLIEDVNGDGKADRSTVFADGFHDPASGLAAGVLARKGDVYFTCIPDLWRLRDTDGDGKADDRKALQTGYGVHVSFIGHDLHGLKFGPDGRLYFSVGDRGMNVKTADGRAATCLDSGAVLRCEPDGFGLEIFATGLRNPQELAFDERGNLFTVDNNSDGGDQARLVHVVEGGDSGWRVGYQYLTSPVSRGPWNAERLWRPRPENQAAYLVPPLANLADGPSGLVYDPGSTRLPERYRRHFFLADFRGGAESSGVRAFTVRPEGATFALGRSEQLLWGVLATDVDFGPDGALYLTDWVQGWNLTGKGRIYKLFDPAVSSEAATEVKTLLSAGFDGRPNDELCRLLGHPDQRVRQEAQFALASRGVSSVDPIRAVAAGPSRPAVARLHAVWGLGQIHRAHQSAEALKTLVTLLDDPDAEVRAQAAVTLGDARHRPALNALIARLKDTDPRARALAAIALGKLGDRAAVGPLLQALRENADRDAVLRHSCVMGLSGAGRLGDYLASASDPSASVRMGVLLTLRRQGRAEIERFLNDPDPRLVTEAALAVYDTPIPPSLPALASLAGRSGLSEVSLRRVVQANARVGGPESARRLTLLAARAEIPESVRVEAVEALAEWPVALGLDRITGLWRPSPALPASEASDALGPVFADLLRGPSTAVSRASLRATGPLAMAGAGAALFAFASDASRSPELRAEALRGLDRTHDPRLADAVRLGAADGSPVIRAEALRLLSRLRPSEALPALSAVLESGTLLERQGAFAALGAMPEGPADATLSVWLDRLKSGRVPSEVELDLLESSRRRTSGEVRRRLIDLEKARSSTSDPVDAYREALAGGDPVRGAKIFKERAEVSCLRCHKVSGQGGEVGPDLTGIGTRRDRRYLLESIVAPNRQIAQGFETLLISTTDGKVHSGILKETLVDSLRLMTPEGKPLTILKTDIDDQKRGDSAMPADLITRLSRPDLRDLVEYLSTIR